MEALVLEINFISNKHNEISNTLNCVLENQSNADLREIKREYKIIS